MWVFGAEVVERALRINGFFVEIGGAGLPTTITLNSRSGKSITARATEMDSRRCGSQPLENTATLPDARVNGVRHWRFRWQFPLTNCPQSH